VDDMDDPTGSRRTTPAIQENEKTTQEDPWTVQASAQNALGRNAEIERKDVKAVKMMLNVVVVDVVADLHLLDRGGASSVFEASR